TSLLTNPQTHIAHNICRTQENIGPTNDCVSVPLGHAPASSIASLRTIDSLSLSRAEPDNRNT
ncbi:MAG: hypothetical protein V3U75_04675, partial [Methylococcaceae bacterium]